MDSQIKQRWITALRSGEYAQGTGTLKSDQGFYCLGVLCDLYAKETGTEWKPKYIRGGEPLPYYFLDGASAILPESVKEWAGLDIQNPDIKLTKTYGEFSLSKFNDLGFKFEEIAQLIEEEF